MINADTVKRFPFNQIEKVDQHVADITTGDEETNSATIYF